MIVLAVRSSWFTIAAYLITGGLILAASCVVAVRQPRRRRRP